MNKMGNSWVEIKTVYKTTKEILLLILLLLIIIMNMQNKLYAIQISHPLTTSQQPVPEQRSWRSWIFTNLMKFLKKDELLEEFELPEKNPEEPSTPPP